MNRQLPQLRDQLRREVLAPDARASRYENHVGARSAKRVPNFVRRVSQPILRFEQAAVARDKAPEHVGVRVVDLVFALRRAGHSHFIARDENPDPRLSDDGDLRQTQRSDESDILRTKAPADAQSR